MSSPSKSTPTVMDWPHRNTRSEEEKRDSRKVKKQALVPAWLGSKTEGEGSPPTFGDGKDDANDDASDDDGNTTAMLCLIP